MVLWRICYTPEDLNQMTAELLATPLGGYLEIAYNYLSMTKRSQYLIGHEHEGQHDSRGTIRAEGGRAREQRRGSPSARHDLRSGRTR